MFGGHDGCLWWSCSLLQAPSAWGGYPGVCVLVGVGAAGPGNGSPDVAVAAWDSSAATQDASFVWGVCARSRGSLGWGACCCLGGVQC